MLRNFIYRHISSVVYPTQQHITNSFNKFPFISSFLVSKPLLRFSHAMVLPPEKMARVLSPQVKYLAEVFDTYESNREKHEIRIAGGAVRDLLQGSVPHDIDFATTATPAEMHVILEAAIADEAANSNSSCSASCDSSESRDHKARLRILALKGEEHGTLTLRVDDLVGL